MAEKRKDYHGAEDHFRRAAEDQPHEPGRWSDLARFLYRQGRYQEAEQAFAQAEKAAPGRPSLLYERAAAYVEAKRNLDEARELLQRYLTLPLTDEDATRADAAKLLRQAQGN
jgi:Flp pilus assembly protein TadD